MGQVASWHEPLLKPATQDDAKEKRRSHLKFAVETFVKEHCVVESGAYVSAVEMQAALCVFLGMTSLYHEDLERLKEDEDLERLKEWYLYGIPGVHMSGIVSYPVWSGIRIHRWPQKITDKN